MMERKVIVLGAAHENTIGIVQSLGEEGLYVIGVLLSGGGCVSKSIYIKEIYPIDNYQEGVEFIAKNLVDSNPTVIIPCGDEAALLLDKNKELLQNHFLFQHTSKNVSLAEAMNKQYQTTIASASGLEIPSSITIDDKSLYKNFSFVTPCIIKPLLSCEGDKNDICVVKDSKEFHVKLAEALNHTNRVIVQEYIDNKTSELNILGCGLSNGDCIIPCSVRKIRIHPLERGSVSVGKVEPISDKLESVIISIKRMVDELGYVGLFSVELICVSDKFYFIEMNLRNDALNPFVVKNGINLPYIHYMDLIDGKLPVIVPIQNESKMIMESVHLTSLFRRSISVKDWIKDIISADHLSLYYKKDRKMFRALFFDRLTGKIKRDIRRLFASDRIN